MRLILPFVILYSAFLSGAELSAKELPSQDSLTITINQADSLFLKNNFTLLAAKFEVSYSDALISQAKLYPNPNLFIDQGAYNHETEKWFDVSPTGQTAASIQQIIILAGKRNKNIDIAKINSEISTYQFFDLLRTLKFELHESFYALYFLRRSTLIYDKEIESLESLIHLYRAQYDKGNISLAELSRLESLNFTLKNERLELIQDIADRQGDLILLMGDAFSRTIIPDVPENINTKMKGFTVDYQQLLDSTLANRYDLKIADEGQKLAQANLSLQKALRVPDITLGANWDRQGSYITNYNSLSVAIDLPVFNRNQGNIRAAEHRFEESQSNYSFEQLSVETEMTKAYDEFIETQKLLDNTVGLYNSGNEKLMEKIISNFSNHTISMLEFIDYFENFKSVSVQYFKLLNKYMHSMENINYVTGTTIFR
jgi:cobalt-zinc-cadmium efflux system outer membrane protein